MDGPSTSERMSRLSQAPWETRHSATRRAADESELLSLPEDIISQIACAAAKSYPQALLLLSATCRTLRALLLSEAVLRDYPSEELLTYVTLERWDKGGKSLVDRLADAGNAGALHFRGLVKVNCSDEGDDAAVITGLQDIGRAAAKRHPPAVFSLLETVQFAAPDRWSGPAAEALTAALVHGRAQADVIGNPAASAAARVSPANGVLVAWNAGHLRRVQRWKRMGGPGILLRLPYLNHCSMEDCGRRCVKGSGFCAQLNFCAECRLQPYCSKNCQTAHWALGHRRHCRQLQVVAMAAHAHAHAVLAAQILNGNALGGHLFPPGGPGAVAVGVPAGAAAGAGNALFGMAAPFVFAHPAQAANGAAAAAAVAANAAAASAAVNAAANALANAAAGGNNGAGAPGDAAAGQQLHLQINVLIQDAFDMVGAAAAGGAAAAVAAAAAATAAAAPGGDAHAANVPASGPASPAPPPQLGALDAAGKHDPPQGSEGST